MFNHNDASPVTHNLTSASYSLVATRQGRRLWLIGTVAVILLGACGLFYWQATRVTPEVALRATIETLQRENQHLTQEVKQQTMNFQHEQAVRASLERELADQGEDLKKARKDLSFYRNSNVARQGQ